MSLKRVLLLSLCMLVLFGLVECIEKRGVSIENDISEEIIVQNLKFQMEN